MHGMGNPGPPGPPGPGQDTQWQSNVFRTSLIRKIEEAIRESGSENRNAADLER